ncbi:hypothetical protein HS1genome_0066 [Sulfodiicoccus acidiphilus]|uniref:Metallo-beta-lactamase domain-containing protein n=1 Tax=Sulfodiicoccus acidiphilus TaxID=1670455 RepID=A0A348B0H5_9CREN|nr:MBL fold metallo-hydrolase [Sulfodiicoccus acidiphilus]BBD71677.1 hypothetical protein HS1genome_0066 [Sulfodiicoccus acidiphilus]GGT86669.1 hypothetical protein GCM10007116_00800 [Sulfodiicoccus acidiphilus]
MKLTRDVEVVPGSPNTLIYQGRIVVDLGGRNAELNLSAEWYLCTHGHADHIAGLKRNGLKYLPSKDMWALSKAGRRSMVYGFSSKDSQLFSYDLPHGDIEAQITDVEVEKVPLPGHTPGHTAYVLGSVAYLGDSVFGQRVLESFVFPFHGDFWQALESLNLAEELVRGTEGAVIAHGPLQTAPTKVLDLIRVNREYMNKLVLKVKDLIASKPQTAEELVVKVMKESEREPSPTAVLLNSVTAKSILVGLGAEPKVTERGIEWALK